MSLSPPVTMITGECRPAKIFASGWSSPLFQMPTVVFFLAKMGVVTARWMLRYFKYAVLIIFIIAAVITPTPDVATQCVFALPMIALYLLGIAVAWIFRKKEVPPDS